MTMLRRILNRLDDRRREGDGVLVLVVDLRDAELAAFGLDVRPEAAEHIVVVRRRAV